MVTGGERNGPSRERIAVWLNDARHLTGAKQNAVQGLIVAQARKRNRLKISELRPTRLGGSRRP